LNCALEITLRMETEIHKNQHRPSHLYSQLTHNQKHELRTKCINILTGPCNMYDGIIRCYACTESIEPPRMISHSIITLIDYLIQHGTKCEGIFRKSGSRKIYEQLEKSFLADANINYAEYSIVDLAATLSYYIRSVLHGLFNEKYLQRIIAAYEKDSREHKMILASAMIHSLSEQERELFLKLKQLFLKIDQERKHSKMTLNNLIIAVPRIFLPKECLKSLKDIKNMQEFLMDIFFVDTDRIPDELWN
jgi:RhoGAP domain